MRAERDKTTGKWLIQYRYTDNQGVRRKSTKRGFETKRDAENWLREFLHTKQGNLNMCFKNFVNEIYYPDMIGRLKENTMRTKRYVISDKILPYFGSRCISDISTADIRKWQSELLAQDYRQTYLRKLHCELTAIFNYATKHYDLKKNPCRQAGSIGKKNADEIKFWTQEEYKRFSDVMLDKPVSFYAFEMLYYTGVRLGELLALCSSDFDFKRETVSITKSYQRIERKDVVTEPKTPKSNRVISMPRFLCEEIQEYIGMLYGIEPNERIFTITKSYLHHELDRGAKETGVKRIKIHEIRHSHVSLLIDMGFSALAISERMGHETENMTLRYSHLFPTRQTEMAEKLNLMKENY